MPIEGNKLWTLRWLSVKMRPKSPKTLGRQRPIVEWPLGTWILLCRSCPLHPTIAFSQHATSRKGGHGGGGERPSFLPSCLWGSTAGMSPRSPWGTNVPFPTADGKHVFGHFLGHSPQASTTMEEPTPVISHPTTLVAPGPSSGIKWWHHLPI